MGWVSQGAFMGFLGITPPLLLWLFGLHEEVVRIQLALNGFGLLLLSGHVLVTGFTTHIKPIRIGTVLMAAYGAFLLLVLAFF